MPIVQESMALSIKKCVFFYTCIFVPQSALMGAANELSWPSSSKVVSKDLWLLQIFLAPTCAPALREASPGQEWLYQRISMRKKTSSPSDFGRDAAAFSGIARPDALPDQCVESLLEK